MLRAIVREPSQAIVGTVPTSDPCLTPTLVRSRSSATDPIPESLLQPRGRACYHSRQTQPRIPAGSIISRLFQNPIRCGISITVLLAMLTGPAVASPFVPAGDLTLRHDIQLLADNGVIKGPTTTWPLAWGPIMADVAAFSVDAQTPPHIVAAIERVRRRSSWEAQTDTLYVDTGAAVAEKPMRIRGFQDTPRARAEITAGFNYTTDRFVVALYGQASDAPRDNEEFRADGSVVGFVLGNYTITANTLDRWWGPGWDGSLILSNNARPIPSLSFDRNFTEPFRSKWLSWIGPWDVSMHFGQLESDRVVPEARFWGLRVNFRPIPSLEIGLSRTAQWCGDGRPCDSDTFVDLLLGQDNRGDDDIDESNEPGNQMAGFDARWATPWFDSPVAVYGQFIGEDEAGGFPSRYLGQLGIEGSGVFRERWSYRWFGELAATNCRFYEASEFPNCAYNHGIYRTGYRYRTRSIGHGADNDARLVSVGLTAVDEAEREWTAVLRFGELNRIGSPDPRNTVTPTPQDTFSIDVRHSRAFDIGEFSIGVGFEAIDDEASNSSNDDFRAFVQWRSSY